MDVNALDQYISKEIRKEVYVDHIKLFLLILILTALP